MPSSIDSILLRTDRLRHAILISLDDPMYGPAVFDFVGRAAVVDPQADLDRRRYGLGFSSNAVTAPQQGHLSHSAT